jgi:hypothetical protein
MQTGWSDALPRSWLDGLFAELCVNLRDPEQPIRGSMELVKSRADRVSKEIPAVELERIVNCVTEAISCAMVRPCCFPRVCAVC